jgi:UDP-N-acetylglucosamine 1-carboxyvinyltransferase
MLPDMIEIGSFIGLAAMTESEITIKNVCYDELGVIPEVFKKSLFCFHNDSVA